MNFFEFILAFSFGGILTSLFLAYSRNNSEGYMPKSLVIFLVFFVGLFAWGIGFGQGKRELGKSLCDSGIISQSWCEMEYPVPPCKK
jgi:hypothetical protein